MLVQPPAAAWVKAIRAPRIPGSNRAHSGVEHGGLRVDRPFAPAVTVPAVDIRRVGTSGLRVSALGLGTMTWGRETDDDAAAEQLRAFVDAGGTLVDTAAGYADGDSERLLGRLLADEGLAGEVVVATKSGVTRRAGARVVDVGRRALLGDLDASLDRLGRDHVDLWQVQAWSADVPLAETLSACEAALASGRTRYVGVSNHSSWQTALAVAGLRESRFGAVPVSDQVEYSLLARGVEAELVPAAGYLGVGLLAWSPLGRGVLTGKYRTGVPADSRAASPVWSGFVDRYTDRRSRRVVEAVSTAADGLGVEPLQVALAWVRDRPGVASAISGARTAAHWRSALGAAAVRLPAEIATALDDVSMPAS